LRHFDVEKRDIEPDLTKPLEGFVWLGKAFDDYVRDAAKHSAHGRSCASSSSTSSNRSEFSAGGSIGFGAMGRLPCIMFGVASRT